MPQNMSEDALDSLVEQRIAQLAAISDKRNALLREMYQMMRKRTNVGATVTIDDEEEDDLHVFLNKYDLRNNPDMGFISHLSENELFDLVPPEEYTSPQLSPQSLLPTSTELKDVARRSKSRSLGKDSMSSIRTTPAAPALDTVEHLDDTIRLSPPSLSASQATTVGAISILGSTESSQSIPVGGPRNESVPISPADCPSPGTTRPPSSLATQERDGALTLEANTAEESSLQPTEMDDGSADVMEVDEPEVKLRSSFSLPPVSEVSQSSHAYNPISSDQPQSVHDAFVSDFNMDVDIESSPMVNLRAKAEISTVARAPPSPKEATTPQGSSLPNSLVSPRVASPRNFGSPAKVTSTVSPSSPVFIPVPSSSFHGIFNEFNFSTVALEPPSAPPLSPTQPRHQLDFRYTLPPLDSLSADFKIKNKKVKQKKKDKEKGKTEGQKDKEWKDDWVPWGLNRWNATIRTNPVYKRVAKATKCLSTRDWAVAMTELKVIRAVDRIELLKSGRWSFRQPKKQRASGGITKTHWDYLMDEMASDFREERKWKMALAYNLSTSVLEWHAAGNREKRLKRGICVQWKPPRQESPKDQIMEDADDVPADPLEIEISTPSGPTRPSSALLNLDYGSDDEDDEEQEKDVDDALGTSVMIEESLADMKQSSYGDGIGFKDLQPKTEEVEDNSALQTESMDVDHPVQSEIDITTRTTARTENDSSPERTLGGLKSTSDNPTLLSLSTSTSLSSERSPIPHSKSSKINLYTPLRANIAHSGVEKLFLDFDDFRITTTDPLSENTIETLLPPSNLSDIFPDFQPYAMFDLAMPIPPVDGKKKSEKKSDRDDPVNKRVDEVAYSKLYPSSTFMFSKPTLVGALQPSKHLRGCQWVDLDETPISIEYEAPQPFRLPEEFNHGIFEHKMGPITISTPAVQSVLSTPAISSPATKFKEPPKRAMEHLWSASDDLLLKSLAEKFPNNWALISECYNAVKVTIKSDWRTSKDCQERWRERWSPAATQRLMETESTAVEGTPPPSTPILMNVGGSRGVKRLASASISNSTAPTISTGSGSEPKKRRRHAMVQDAVRRSIKKRNEAAQKNNVRKSATMHESHNDFSNLAKMTPAEISRRKSDRDLQQSQELQLARARALAGPNGAGTRTPIGQQPTAAVVNGTQRPSLSGASAPPVAQIRNQQVQVPISQQQRAATPLVAGNSHAQTAAALRGNLQQALAQNGVNGNAQLSPPYIPRDATSSPAHASPPRSTGTPSNGAVNSPRPSSAQAQSHPLGQTQSQSSTPQLGIMQNGQIGAMNIPQARNIQGHYYLPNVSASYTPEQLQQSMLRMQNLRNPQQQAQQLQQAQQQSQPLPQPPQPQQ
ncbi:hypothetical protein HHX47_DHR1001148 [Lentinula edodes]|nr:hypothetical protein HHX47_DHR1001148 [Lentinula edodes]